MKKIFFFLSVIVCLSAAAEWKLLRGNAVADKGFRRIKGEGVFQKKFSVTSGKIYLFSAEVTSAHEIYFSFSPVSQSEKKIAYTTPGKKQKVMGLVVSDCSLVVSSL